MSQTHWVHRFDFTRILASAIYAGAFIASATIVSNALTQRPAAQGDNLTVQITNEGRKPVIQAYYVNKDGQLVPVK